MVISFVVWLESNDYAVWAHDSRQQQSVQSEMAAYVVSRREAAEAAQVRACHNQNGVSSQHVQVPQVIDRCLCRSLRRALPMAWQLPTFL